MLLRSHKGVVSITKGMVVAIAVVVGVVEVVTDVEVEVGGALKNVPRLSTRAMK